MLISITTTTTTTIASGQVLVLGAIGTVVLITLLIAKELLSASENKKALLLGKNINIAIFPLLFAFAMIVLVKIMEVL